MAPEKTRLVPFGRKAWREGHGTAGSFDFLGFSHYLGTTSKGHMTVVRIPARKSVHRFLMAVKEWLRRNVHTPPRDQQRELAARLRGFYQYYGLYGCTRRLAAVRYQVTLYWRAALGHRSQRAASAWAVLQAKPWFKLPTARVAHPSV